jgi:hypothetical protein
LFSRGLRPVCHWVSRQPGFTQPERIIYHVFQQRASGLQPVLKEYIGFTGFLH